MRTSLRHLLVAIVATTSLVACGGGGKSRSERIEDGCNAEGACEGKTADQIAACISDNEGLADEADMFGCSAELDALFDCAEETGMCTSGSYDTDCSAEFDALGSCEQQ